MANFTFTGRIEGGRPMGVEAFTVQAADRFEAFRTAAALRPEVLDLALLRGDGLCPACNGDGVMTDDPQVNKCRSCGGFFTANDSQPITFDQALQFVALHLNMAPNVGAAGTFYFDFMLSTTWDGKPAVGRVHGWADHKTRRVVQFG